MALTKGPLLSLDASGTVADTAVFAKWKGRNYVRIHATPANPQTDLQTAIRAVVGFTSRDFKNLTSQQKNEWKDIADQSNITAINAYVANSAKLARQNLGWPRYPSAPSQNAPSPPSELSVTASFRSLSVRIKQGSNKPNYAWLVYVILEPQSPRQFAALTAIAYPDANAENVTVEITNLDPGTYKINARGMMIDGTLGDYATDDVTATVP